MNINIDAMKYKILKQIAATKILMIRYKKELFDITQEINNNKEDMEYFLIITKEINYIVGVLKLNEMHLKNILTEIRENKEYIDKYYNEIMSVISRISQFNKMIKLN